jgi:CBS-domain-containing membrane protein
LKEEARHAREGADEPQPHHLPVLDRDGRLVGIVIEKDLLYASPSPATTLGTFLADDTTQGRLTVKVEGLSKEKISEALRPLAVRIEDIRES